MDDLRSLVSSRNLSEGGFDSPLRDFTGVFKGWTAATNTNYPNRLDIRLQFTEVQVLESRTPWPHPVAELSFGSSQSAKSRWGYFATSCNQFVGEAQEWHALEGHRLHLRRAERPIWNREKGTEVPTSVWEVVEVDGRGAGAVAVPAVAAAKANPKMRAIRLLDGKTAAEFNSAALRDRGVTGDGALVSAILNQTFLVEVTSTGVAVMDSDKRYHVAPAVLAANPE